MCAQPCRKEYKTSCGEKSYFLSPKDQLYGFDEIKKLQEIGVESIKVEGRMKDVSYVYGTVNYFRSLINGIDKEENTPKLFNRGYSRGYFYNNDKIIMNRDYSFNMGEKIGEVFGKNIKLTDDVVAGDGITFVSKDYKSLGGTYLNKAASKNEKISLNFPDGTKYIFRNFNKRLNENLKLKIYLEDENKNRILEIQEISEIKTQEAQKKSVTVDDVKEKISEIGDSEFSVKNIEVNIDENIFIPMSELKNLKRLTVEKFRQEILSYFRRELDEELKILNREYYKLEIEKDEPKDLEIRVIVSNNEQEKFVKSVQDDFKIKKIYRRTYDIAKQGNLNSHNLENNLASNLYELLENENPNVMLNWNMNIVNSYTMNVLEKNDKLESFIVSPEINFAKIRTLGKSKLKKALLIYSKLKGMTVDVDLADGKDEVITNKENDRFSIIRNEFGTELFLERPLNIINIMDDIKKLNVDVVVLEFTTETVEDMKKVLKQLKTRKGEYREYNYKRGVY